MQAGIYFSPFYLFLRSSVYRCGLLALGLLAVGLRTHTRMQAKILAETARGSKLHIDGNFLDRVVGIAQPAFDFTNGDVVDESRRRLPGYRSAYIGQVFCRNSHFIRIPRHGMSLRTVFFQQLQKLSEQFIDVCTDIPIIGTRCGVFLLHGFFYLLAVANCISMAISLTESLVLRSLLLISRMVMSLMKAEGVCRATVVHT